MGIENNGYENNEYFIQDKHKDVAKEKNIPLSMGENVLRIDYEEEEVVAYYAKPNSDYFKSIFDSSIKVKPSPYILLGIKCSGESVEAAFDKLRKAILSGKIGKY